MFSNIVVMADQMDGEVRDLEHLNSEIKRDDDDVQYSDMLLPQNKKSCRKGSITCSESIGARTEFGRDTSRLDYFRVSPLEVSYDLENDESDYYGGGSSHNGQQQSSLTGNFDTSDLHLDDGTRSQEESISTAGLGTTENVHAEKTDIGGYKYHPLHVVSYPFDQIREDLSYTEEPESILDRQDRVMRNKTIPFVKILWRNHPEREATWETEESIRTSYPHFLP
ncbi:hypothetical protein Tco_0017545 [Tanacetum coccineum]